MVTVFRQVQEVRGGGEDQEGGEQGLRGGLPGGRARPEARDGVGASGEELRVQLQSCSLQERPSSAEECYSVAETRNSAQQKLK